MPTRKNTTISSANASAAARQSGVPLLALRRPAWVAVGGDLWKEVADVGAAVRTHSGHPYLILQVSLFQQIMHVKRATAIVYPKEIGYILLKINAVNGARIVEAGTGSGKSGNGTLTDQLTLELGQGGEDAEGKPPVRRRGVDLRAGAGQHLQPNTACAQILDRVDQVTQVAAQSVKLPEHQRVARLDRLQAGGQAGTGVVATGCQILVNASGVDASGQQGITLWRQRLGAV